MATSFVPSLHHLTCSRLVALLFNNLEVQKNIRKNDFELIKSQVAGAISRLTPSTRLREKLETFIDPLVREIETWIKLFEHIWYGYDCAFRVILKDIPQCWLSDGTIDREKSAKALVKNKDLKPVNRFVIACTYCFFDDVLALWKILYKIEMAYLRHKSSPVVKHWVEWLESSSTKDWEFFVAWSLGTPVWCSNVYILKHSLPTLSPAEKSRYLLKALIGREEVGIDVMRFCISALTKDEQEQIFRESPVDVFRCISSWPLRSIFFDIADNLWTYLTEDSYCSILNMILLLIKDQNRPDVELLTLLKNFWAQSPRNFQNIAKDDDRFSKPLQFILDFDVSQEFPKRKFSEFFLRELPNTLPMPLPVFRRRRRRGVRRNYRNML